MQLSLFPTKKYRITESQPATTIWTHYVEAESEEEAIDKMYRGKIIDTSCITIQDETYVITLEDIEEVE